MKVECCATIAETGLACGKIWNGCESGWVKLARRSIAAKPPEGPWYLCPDHAYKNPYPEKKP